MVLMAMVVMVVKMMMENQRSRQKKEHYSRFLGPLSYCGVCDLCKNIQPFVEGRTKWRRGEMNK